jgi:hypothetical protein
MIDSSLLVLTALNICPATTTSMSEYPSRMINVKTTISFDGHHPMIYLENTMVLLPDLGPKVAMYATGRHPTSIPNTAHRQLSRNGRENTVGPSIPKVVLLAVRLIETQSMQI